MLGEARLVGLVGSLDILYTDSPGASSDVGLGMGLVRRGIEPGLPPVSRLGTTNPLVFGLEVAGAGICTIAEDVVTVMTPTG